MIKPGSKFYNIQAYADESVDVNLIPISLAAKEKSTNYQS